MACYYFYVWDADFGMAFFKVCAYFPYLVKIWLNGHKWAKRQATRAGIEFRELSNGFATTNDAQGCRASATGSGRARSRCSANGGGPGCRCR